MKRDAEPVAQNTYRVWNWFFWDTCVSCGKEFRRERGWRTLTGPWFRGCGQWRYTCGTCAQTAADAERIAQTCWIPKTCPPPPKGDGARVNR